MLKNWKTQKVLFSHSTSMCDVHSEFWLLEFCAMKWCCLFHDSNTFVLILYFPCKISREHASPKAESCFDNICRRRRHCTTGCWIGVSDPIWPPRTPRASTSHSRVSSTAQRINYFCAAYKTYYDYVCDDITIQTRWSRWSSWERKPFALNLLDLLDWWCNLKQTMEIGLFQTFIVAVLTPKVQ